MREGGSGPAAQPAGLDLAAVEVIDDKALALPPLNMRLAREVMARTRIYRLLEGHRGLAGADLDEIALTLIKVSQLVVDLAEVVHPHAEGDEGTAQGSRAGDAALRACLSKKRGNWASARAAPAAPPAAG